MVMDEEGRGSQDMEQITTFRSRLERTVFAPFVRTSNAYYWLVAGLAGLGSGLGRVWVHSPT